MTDTARGWYLAALGLGAAVLALPLLAARLPEALRPELAAPGVAAVLLLAAFVWRPVIALIVFAMFVLFYDSLALVGVPQLKYVDELVIPAMLLITLWRQRTVIVSRVAWLRDGAVAVLVLAAVASSLLNGVAFDTWFPGFVLLVKGLALFYTVLLLPIEASDLLRAGRVVFAVGIAVVLVAVVEFFAPAVLGSIGIQPWRPRSGLPALKSLFVHPVLFGWFTAFVGLYLFAHFALLRRWWMLAAGLVFSLGTILSARRRAILALGGAVGIGVGWDVVREPRAWRGVAMRWAPVAAGLLVLVVGFLPSLESLYERTVVEYVESPGGPSPRPDNEAPQPPAEGTAARVALYYGSLSVARDYFPLGAGLGRYGSWMSRVNYSPLYEEYGLSEVHGLGPRNPAFVTDTFWPQILGETGVVGLAAYLTFLAVVGFALLRISRRTGYDPWVAAILLGTVLVFAQAGVESLASAMYHSPPRVDLLWLTAGAALAFDLERRRGAGTATGPSWLGA